MLQLLLELNLLRCTRSGPERIPNETLNSVILPMHPEQLDLPYSVIACAERAHAVRDNTGQPCVAPEILRPGPCLAPSK